MALAPEFDFDALIKQMAGGNAPAAPAAAAPVAPAVPTRAERFGARAARMLKSPFFKFLPGLGILAETATGGDTVPNAIRTGVGIGALANPVVGAPLATGMLAAEGIASGLDAAFQPGKSDIMAPAFAKTVEAAGGTSAYVKGLGMRAASAAPAVLTPDAAFSPADQKPGFQGGYQAPAPIQGYGANSRPYQPVTRTVNPDGTVSITGSGTPRYSSGVFSGFGAAPSSVAGSNFQPKALPQIDMSTGLPGTTPEDRANVGNIAGNFMGALVGMKQISGDNAARAAQTKAMIEAVKASSHIGLQAAQAGHAGAQAQDLLARQALARAALQRGANEAEVAGILSGRPVPADSFAVPVGLGGMKPTDPSTVLNRRTGALTVTTPMQRATDQTVKATLAAHPEFKGDRATAIAALKATGRYLVDDLK